MEIQSDFRDLLKLFNEHEVQYILVGGYALAFHGAPRYTGDIDLYVNPTLENAQNILLAIDDFGFGSLGLSLDDFQFPDKVVQLGMPPVRIDIITSLSGVTWELVFNGRIEGKYGDLSVFYIGLNEFVANKRATGRKKDLADLEAIGED